MAAETEKTVVIIGGGYSGTVLAIHLLALGASNSGLRIHLIESRDDLGLGIAYGDAQPFHILNVPAGRMGIWPDQNGDFLEFARSRGPALGWPEAGLATAESYLPRRLFGHFVQAELLRMLADVRDDAGTSFRHHATAAVSVERSEGGFVVGTSDGAAVKGTDVILATGFRQPHWPFPVDGESGRLIADPWRQNDLARIARTDTVLVVGAGLTMVDVVAGLERSGHRGRITVVSRRGLMPFVHGVSRPLAPVLTPAFAAEGASRLLARFRRIVRDGQADWRSAVDSLRPVTDDLWQALPADGQKRFLRHAKVYWDSHRHRMPADCADMLLGRVGRDELSIRAGRIGRIRAAEDELEARIRFRGDTRPVIRRFDWAVNCTAPASPASPPVAPLVRHLLAVGLARPHHTGLGFEYSSQGFVLDAHGLPVPGFFLIGPPRLGVSVEVTSVPFLRGQIAELARSVLSRRPEPAGVSPYS